MMRPVILLVNPDPVVQHMVCTILKTEGMVTTIATSGADALWMVSVRQPHVLIMDDHLPDMDGVTFAIRLHDLVGSATIPMLWLMRHPKRLATVPMAVSQMRVLRTPFSADELLRIVLDLIASTPLHGQNDF